MTLPFDPRLFRQTASVPSAYQGLFSLPFLDQPLSRVWYIGQDQDFFEEWERVGEYHTFTHLMSAFHALNGLPAESHPEAIICSTTPPDGSPLNLARLIQGNPDWQHMPFVLIGEQEGWPEREAALDAGIDDCYPPSVSLDQLCARIAFLSQRKEEVSELKKASEPVRLYHRTIGKRVFDLTLSGLALALLAPLLLAIWVYLRLTSKETAWERLPRIGTGYQQMECLAFRSAGTSAKGVAGFYNRTIRHLPRLINVLKGDLSIVGNRPIPMEEAERLTNDQWGGRFLSPAGLTGAWRFISHDVQRQRQAEIEYALHNSLFGDVVILVRTLATSLGQSSTPT